MSNILITMAAVSFSWVGVSIETGKHDEQMFQHYFRDAATCRSSKALPGDLTDRVCIPVPELPEEFFEQQKKQCKANAERYAWLDSYRKPMLEACLRD